eukprot:gene25773-11440_t
MQVAIAVEISPISQPGARLLPGAGVAGGLSMYTLRQDIVSSQGMLIRQGEDHKAKMERRIAALEAALSKKYKQ